MTVKELKEQLDELCEDDEIIVSLDRKCYKTFSAQDTSVVGVSEIVCANEVDWTNPFE